MCKKPEGKPIRYSQVCLDYVPESGGTSQSVSHFIQSFQNHSIFSTISFTSMSHWNKRSLSSSVINILVGNSFIGRRYSLVSSHALIEAESLLKKSHVIFIHMLYRYHAQWASAIAIKYNIPTVVIPHGSLDPYVFTYRSWQKKLWLKVFGKKVLGGASYILFATEQERRKAFYHCLRSRAKVVSWPVEKGMRLDRENASQIIKKKMGILRNEHIILFLGRLHPVKRPLETVRAFAQSDLEKYHLVVIGPETPEIRYTDVRYAAGVAKSRVHVVGAVFGSEKEDYLQAADYYVLFSKKENFSYSVAEALSAGTPVIISAEVDLSGIVKTHCCGNVVNDTDEKTLIGAFNAIEKLDENKYSAMQRAGIQLSKSEFAFRNFQNKLVDIAVSVTKSTD